MGLDFGALIPALAQGASSYMQGQRIGEHDREQRDALLRQRAFEEWARKQQLAQSASALDQKAELDHQKRVTDLLLQGMRNQGSAAVANTNAGARRDVGAMQYEPGGSADRGNASRAAIAKDNNASAEQRIRISVDGANRRDNIIVQMPDGTSAFVDATGRLVPIQGKPVQGTGQNGRNTVAQRQAQGLLDLGVQGAQGAAEQYKTGYVPSTKDKIGEALPDFIGNPLMSDKSQKLYSDLTKLVLASQYALSGKAVTENEARKLARGLVIVPGDKPEMIEYKKRELQQRINILGKNAGETAPTLDFGQNRVDPLTQKKRP